VLLSIGRLREAGCGGRATATGSHRYRWSGRVVAEGIRLAGGGWLMDGGPATHSAAPLILSLRQQRAATVLWRMTADQPRSLRRPLPLGCPAAGLIYLA